jgi:mannose-6-phosphate isomerase-like protein (cupin superfamily)
MKIDGRESTMTNYEGMIVRKPWGYEYLMYQSDKIGLWYLHIEEGAQTSLHCHPGKKTGYILLFGEAQVSFLNDSTTIRAVSKLMLREGLFHSTKAISAGGVHVLEVESPPDKNNLVRLDDHYGRKEQPYEGSESTVPMTADCVTLASPVSGTSIAYTVQGVSLFVESFDDLAPLKTRPPGEIILVMDGGLVGGTGEYILAPGDVVSIATINRLSDTFPAPRGISLMTVRPEKKDSVASEVEI